MRTWIAEVGAGWNYAWAVWTRRLSVPAFLGFWGAITFMSLLLDLAEFLALWVWGRLT